MFPIVMRVALFMAVLTAIYIALGRYLRWDRARRLEAEHGASVAFEILGPPLSELAPRAIERLCRLKA